MTLGLLKTVLKRGTRVSKLAGYGNGVTIEHLRYQIDREALTIEYAIVPEDDATMSDDVQGMNDVYTLRENRRLTRSTEFVLPSSEGWDVRLTTRASSEEVEQLPWTARAIRSSSSASSSQSPSIPPDQIVLRVTHAPLIDDHSVLKVRVVIEISGPSSGLRLNGIPQTIQDVEDRDPSSYFISQQILQDVSSAIDLDFQSTSSVNTVNSSASADSVQTLARPIVTERTAAADKSILSRVRRNYIYFSSLLQEPEAKWRRSEWFKCPATESRGVAITQLDSIDPTLVVYRAEATFVGVGLWDLYGAVVSPGAKIYWDKQHEDAVLLEDVNELTELWHYKTRPAWPVKPKPLPHHTSCGNANEEQQIASPAIECELRCDIDTWAFSLDIVVDPPPQTITCLRRHRLSIEGGGLWITMTHDAMFVDDDRLLAIVRRAPCKEKGLVMINGTKVPVDVEELPESEIKLLTKQKRVKPQRIPLDQPPVMGVIRRRRAEWDEDFQSDDNGGVSVNTTSNGLSTWASAPRLSSPLARFFTYAVDQATTTTQQAMAAISPAVATGNAAVQSPSKAPMQYVLDALAWTQETHTNFPGTGWQLVSEKGLPIHKKLAPEICSVIPIHKGFKVIEGVSAEELAAVITEPDCQKKWDDRYDTSFVFESFGGKSQTSFVVSKAGFPWRDRGFYLASVMARAASTASMSRRNTSQGEVAEQSNGIRNAVFCVSASFSPDSVSRFTSTKYNSYSLPIGRVYIDAWILETLDPYTTENYAIPSTRCTRLVAVDYAGSIPAAVNTVINATLPRSILALEAYIKGLTPHPDPLTGEMRGASPRPPWLVDMRRCGAVVEVEVRPRREVSVGVGVGTGTGSVRGKGKEKGAVVRVDGKEVAVIGEKESMTCLGRDELLDDRVSKMGVLSRIPSESEPLPEELKVPVGIADELLEPAGTSSTSGDGTRPTEEVKTVTENREDTPNRNASFRFGLWN
ncbi:hypothetical protein C0992_000889 [Termitomyces sp. T32_za158]|nr:hypothetical protein C0992_000889 [Termitomyces sp. T32_za158]